MKFDARGPGPQCHSIDLGQCVKDGIARGVGQTKVNAHDAHRDRRSDDGVCFDAGGMEFLLLQLLAVALGGLVLRDLGAAVTNDDHALSLALDILASDYPEVYQYFHLPNWCLKQKNAAQHNASYHNAVDIHEMPLGDNQINP
mmetsp:Transcript_13191/g.27016  ORF Transcript_13191/g.27016 Transcript_13191/m.27016 type:complete len:143 (-) Transcript_13191:11-439(-)